MRSLAFKLALAFLLVGLTGAVLVALLVRYTTQLEFGRLVLDQNQQALVNNLSIYYAQTDSWEGVELVFRFSNAQNAHSQTPEQRWDVRRVLFMIADAQGQVVYGGKSNYLDRTLTKRQLSQGVAIQVDGETVGWLLLVPSLERWEAGTPEGDFLITVNRAAYLSAMVATLIALLLGGVLAYGLTRSLREMTTATRALAAGELGRQVPVRSKDELGTLADSFNQMSLQLAHSTELRRQMTANIAHDLRSPLTVILGYAEALHDGKLHPTPETFEIIHNESLQLSRLIDDLKTLSLADARELPLLRQHITPSRLLHRTADALRIRADQHGVTISTQSEPDLPEIDVDVERILQVLRNLVENSLRFTQPGGQIQLLAGRAGDQVHLQVADTGAGISAEDLPYIFERTYRGDKARRSESGESGLGLAIAKSLVEAHGGQISVTSNPGSGAIFTITLPAA